MLKKISLLLTKKEFISVATVDQHARPNAAPKFLLKYDGKYVYLVDYSRGRTWENLKHNPHVSLSLMDTDALIGYQINGIAEIIEAGPLYEKMQPEFVLREINLSASRVIEGVSKEKLHQSYEVVIPEKVVIFKIKIEEVAEIGNRGEIKREKV